MLDLHPGDSIEIVNINYIDKTVKSDVIEAWTRDDTFDPSQEESIMMFTKYKGE